MKFPTPLPILEVAKKIGATVIGDKTLFASGINEIHKVEPGDITFSDVRKYFKKSLDSAATIIILNEEAECPPGKAILLCENPFQAYDSLISEFRPFSPQRDNIGQNSEVHPTTLIEPNVIIGHHVSIGKNCHIKANVVIGNHVKIGDNVIIEPNSTIGSDAFYFKKADGKYTKWTTGGRVIIENEVYIGPNCTIAKGVSGDTIIGEGSKLDSQIQLGHGVVLGKNCLLAAQVGIAGKTVIGNNVTIYGQAGLAQNLIIGDDTLIAAKAGVSKSLAGGKAYFGIPAKEIQYFQRELVALRQLPDFLKKNKK